jgi:ribokinase
MSVCVIGSLNLDLVSRVQALPRPGETVLATSVTRHVGGKGANQAVAAARAGASTRLLGSAGQDDDGAWLLAYLAAAGVDVSAIVADAEIATGQAFITIDETSENTIVVSGGANAVWRGPSDMAAAIGAPRVLLAQLELDLDVVAAALAACGPDTLRPDTLRIVNAAPATPKAAALFPVCDLLIVNETELSVYAGAPAIGLGGASLTDFEAAARRLLARPNQSVILTLGAAGVLAIDADGATHIPAYPVTAVDTVGAGDCFCGFVAAGLAAGRPLIDAARQANVAAALAVTRSGAAEAMPTLAEVSAALAAGAAVDEMIL